MHADQAILVHLNPKLLGVSCKVEALPKKFILRSWCFWNVFDETGMECLSADGRRVANGSSCLFKKNPEKWILSIFAIQVDPSLLFRRAEVTEECWLLEWRFRAQSFCLHFAFILDSAAGFIFAELAQCADAWFTLPSPNSRWRESPCYSIQVSTHAPISCRRPGLQLHTGFRIRWLLDLSEQPVENWSRWLFSGPWTRSTKWTWYSVVFFVKVTKVSSNS